MTTDIDAIVRMTRSGATARQIARTLGISKSTVIRCRVSTGVRGLDPNAATAEQRAARRADVAVRYPNGATLAVLAVMHDVHPSTVSDDLASLGIPARPRGRWSA